MYQRTLTLFSLLFFAQNIFAQTTIVNYAPSTADIANPERGIYHFTETHSNSYVSLNAATLQNFRTNENITLIIRVFYLENFLSSNISNAYLTQMQNDFNQLRAAGLKCIVRFAYTNQSNGWPPVAPYGDATKAWMLTHIGQLEPYLRANSDVIAVVNAGFIGIWGEWYYTTYFGDPSIGPLTAVNYSDRKEITDRLLLALPPERMIQVRTPFSKYKLYTAGTPTPISNAQAHTGTSISRIGHHNDCFLASSDDYGTYINSATEYPYLAAETNYLPMGGETCALNTPRTNCNGDALNELALFHWSFINLDYINTVWNDWTSQGCYLQIKKSLGYRFQLNAGSFSTTAKPGGSMNINISLTNTGWAAPYNPRFVELILKNASDGKVCRARLPVDPRFWLSGSNQNLNFEIGIPANFPNGTYHINLSLPDPQSSLYENSNYSIRLANLNTTWDASTGYNYLGSDLIINNSHVSSNYNGSLWFDQCYGALPVEWVDFKAEQQAGVNLLSWITNEEVNNSHFEIERSSDGMRFEVIGKIPATNKSFPASYIYQDLYSSNKIDYYRIAQYDLDGSVNYSPIRACITPSKVFIYPNPFTQQIQLDFGDIMNENIHIEIMDITGKSILKKAKGTDQVLMLGKELPSGIYQLRIISDEGYDYYPLIKND